jgi:hypothetical protein
MLPWGTEGLASGGRGVQDHGVLLEGSDVISSPNLRRFSPNILDLAN